MLRDKRESGAARYLELCTGSMHFKQRCDTFGVSCPVPCPCVELLSRKMQKRKERNAWNVTGGRAVLVVLMQMHQSVICMPASRSLSCHCKHRCINNGHTGNGTARILWATRKSEEAVCIKQTENPI